MSSSRSARCEEVVPKKLRSFRSEPGAPLSAFGSAPPVGVADCGRCLGGIIDCGAARAWARVCCDVVFCLFWTLAMAVTQLAVVHLKLAYRFSLAVSGQIVVQGVHKEPKMMER